MDLQAITSSYRRWAPIYDDTFGRITQKGRRQATAAVNALSGRVLEVGVGTGLALGGYAPHLEVTGIDFSEEMLARARQKVASEGLTQVRELRQMDARSLDFPDGHFDSVVAMYLVSVVPEPERVMAEIARVCKPGGQVIIVNHFAREQGVLALAERAMAPLSNLLGWHSDFKKSRILGESTLKVIEERSMGLFTFIRMEKTVEGDT